jgi:hypothetical protein
VLCESRKSYLMHVSWRTVRCKAATETAIVRG